jgi:hypothetical protein
MRDPTSSNANSNYTKSTIIKAGSTFTSPKMVTDLQSSFSSHNRPRIVSFEFHSSPPQPLRVRLLPRNLSKKLISERRGAHDDSIDLALMPVNDTNHEICLTPAPIFETEILTAGPPMLASEESRILLSPTMPRQLLVPDDF